MTDDPRAELDEVLGPAVQQLNDSGDNSETPPDLNAQVLEMLGASASKIRLAADNPLATTHLSPKGNRMMMVFKYGLAASVLAAVGIGLGIFGIPGGHGVAFAEVANRLAQVRSFTCRVQFIGDAAVETADGDFGQKLTYVAPSKHRIDDPIGTTQIIDQATNTMVFQNHQAKESLTITGDLVRSMDAVSPARFVEAVREHFHVDRTDNDGIKEVEPRVIDGAKTFGLRSAMNGEIIEAWFDETTHLPKLIRVRFAIPSHALGGSDTSMWRVLTDLAFDEEVDPRLFSMQTPEGYKSTSMESPVIDQSPATVDDLIAMLRACANESDGVFPLSLSPSDEQNTAMGVLTRYSQRLEQQFGAGNEADRQAAVQQMTQFAAVVGRANGFLFSMNANNKFQYFGGATLNDSDRPLLWYSPDGSDKYTIVYANLVTKEATTETLPPAPIVPKSVHQLAPENVVRVNTPHFELPRQAIREYDDLQRSRDEGRQAEVEYLSIAWMPEFVESQVQPDSDGNVELKEVSADWVPGRSSNSSRLGFLEEFSNLKGLDVSHMYLTHNDLDIIATCDKLERLSLSGVQVLERKARRLAADDLKRFQRLMSLQVLDLSQANFGGGLKHLGYLPALHTMYFSSFEHLNDQTVAELRVLPHLETLVLAPVYADNPKTCVTEKGLEGLRDLPKLRTLYVGYHGKWTLPVDKLRELLPDVNVVPPR